MLRKSNQPQTEIWASALTRTTRNPTSVLPTETEGGSIRDQRFGTNCVIDVESPLETFEDVTAGESTEMSADE